MEERHNMLNTVRPVAAAGESAANDRRRHKTGWGGRMLLDCLLFLRLGLGDILNLFLHRGELAEQREVRFRKRRSDGLFARRWFFTLWIYL